MNHTIRAAVLTISDRCHQGTAVDHSGPALEHMLQERLDASIVHRALVPDDAARITECLRAWLAPKDHSGASHDPLDLIVSTGGTGLGPRDVTPEAADQVIERPCPGLMELARSRCVAAEPRAALSRGVAGIAGRTLIVTLPGSPRGATDTLGAILDVVPHAVRILRGDRHG